MGVFDFLTGGQKTGVGNSTGLNLNFGQAIANRNAMAGPQIAMDPQNQFRGYQMQLADQLNGQTQGIGPSLAQQQLQAGTDQNLQAQMAMAASGRPVNGGFAQRLAMMQMGQTQQQAAQQSALLRLQEQLQAQQQLAGLSGQGREQDIGLATNQANLGLQDQQLKDQFQLGLSQLGVQRDVGAADIYNRESQRTAPMSFISSLSGGVAQGLATAARSDERAKTDIQDGSGKLAEFLSKVGVHDYKYKDGAKDPLAGEGRYISPMAQELEQTEVGRSMVKNTPQGKVVDYGKGFGAMLAALAMQQRKIDALERGVRG